MNEKKYGFNTTMIHAGFKPDSDTGSMALPIYQTTAYEFQALSMQDSFFCLKSGEYIYKNNKPTQGRSWKKSCRT
jgi:O-acetylhomoserine (thiol)-lyase